MKALSSRARRVAMGLFVTTVVIAAVGSVGVANTIVIDAASLSGNLVTVTVTNLGGKSSVVRVHAQYLEGKQLFSDEQYVTVPAGTTVNVGLILGTITDDINPQGITEGPDPIPQMIALGTALWGD